MHRSHLTRNIVIAGTISILALGACTTAQESAQQSQASESGCPVDTDDSVSGEVQLAYQPIPNGDLVVRDEAWLEECLPNMTIHWNQFASGAEVVQAFGSGTIDLGLVGSSPAVTLMRSEEHTSELQSRGHLVCRLLLEKKK